MDNNCRRTGVKAGRSAKRPLKMTDDSGFVEVTENVNRKKRR